MWKKTGEKVLAAVLAVIMVVSVSFTAGPEEVLAADTKKNQKQIYQYLTQSMELPAAAACGILANIQYESGFDPKKLGDHGTSYGICQWHASRFTALKKYCSDRKLAYKTLAGQLAYLEYECQKKYSSVFRYLKNVSNDKEGAYQAGYYWCYHFEKPAGYATVSVTRGKVASSTYWPEFGAAAADDVPKLTGVSLPKTMKQGQSFTVSGKAVASGQLARVSVEVSDYGWKAYTGGSMIPGGSECDLSDLQKLVRIEKLPAGVFRYKARAVSSTGGEALAEKVFPVLARGSTLKGGNYQILCAENEKYGMAAGADGSLALSTKISAKDCRFQLVHYGSGYYGVRSLKTDRYLTRASDGSVSLATWQGDKSQLWQVLEAEEGTYCLVPKSATGKCLAVAKKIKSGASFTTSAVNMEELQLFTIKAASDKTALIKLKKLATLSLPETVLEKTYSTKAFSLNAKSDGTLTYESSKPKVAKVSAKGKVTMKGYGRTVITVTAAKDGGPSQSEQVTLTVLPKKAALEELTPDEDGTCEISWKQDELAAGYLLQLSSSSKFTSGTTKKKTIKGNDTLSYTAENLEAGETYYVRIRAYTTVDGKKLYGDWSKVLKVTMEEEAQETEEE